LLDYTAYSEDVYVGGC